MEHSIVHLGERYRWSSVPVHLGERYVPVSVQCTWVRCGAREHLLAIPSAFY